MIYTAAVITVSDSCARGEREDVSGPAIVERLRTEGYDVREGRVVADEIGEIRAALLGTVNTSRLVVTTGGTGIAAQDVTPEATVAVCEKLLPGLSERMRIEGRKQTELAALSRAVCGTRGTSLIINLPGSPQGALLSLAVVLPLVPHALELLAGNTRH